MPGRCCRKKCARKLPHIYCPFPRPCLDSLRVPADFFLTHGVFYSPPCYHIPVEHEITCGCPRSPSKEEVTCGCPKTPSKPEVTCECHTKSSKDDVICGCPKVPTDISPNPYCMAANNGSSCSGHCKPKDSKKHPRGPPQGRQDQVPRMPSMNHFVEPPQYNNQFPSSRPRYGPHDRHPFKQASATTLPGSADSAKGRGIEPPPPQYDTMDSRPPDYPYPAGMSGSCCQSSENYTEIRTVRPQKQPSPRISRTPSPYDRPEQVSNEIEPRPQSTPEPKRRPDSNQNPRSFNSPPDQGYYSSSPAKPPLHMSKQAAPRYDSEAPCCANASGQKKREGPPMPHKGISGAHRPGYLVEDENDPQLADSRCMSAHNSSCVHGITSIMPNYTSHVMPEKKPSVKGTACICKDATGKTVKATKKKNCRREEGTDVCQSMTCLANKNRYCPCTYPPAFKQFSCTGNITGTCDCTQPFP